MDDRFTPEFIALLIQVLWENYPGAGPDERFERINYVLAVLEKKVDQ